MKKEYESGSVRSMILPDRTGYCKYVAIIAACEQRQG